MTRIRDRILWSCALRLIRKYRPTVIAIGGAIAKTSTKEAVATVLSDKFPNQVQSSFGNLNTYLGVPLTVLGFEIDFYQRQIRWQWPVILFQAVVRSITRKLPAYLILEYGTDKPGDIPALVEKIPPRIALLTIVGPAHLENYSSERAIAKEEGFLVESVPSSGLVILNKQDPYLGEHRERVVAETVVVDCSLEEIATSYAKAVGQHFGMDPKRVADLLEDRKLPSHRFNKYRLKTWLILDDSYNANPLSMKAALNVLRNTPSKRRVAILGDMLELGKDQIRMHEEIGRLAKSNSDLIIGVGELAKHYHPDYWFESSQIAAKEVLAQLTDGDTILVKGSHGVKMEIIIEALHGDI